MENISIGIDFGTTNTSVTIIFNNEIKNLGENGEYPFVSAIAIPKDTSKPFLFSREVKDNKYELAKDYEVITSIKSYLGTDKEFIVANRIYTPVDITALFLQYVKDTVKKNFNIEIDSAIFAFPVDFSPKAREDLFKSAEKVDIKVKNFINEATAGYLSMCSDIKSFSSVMVVDWGGGTLDISILDIHKNTILESVVYGEKIGGDDIDLLLAKYIHNRLVQKYNLKKSFDEISFKDKDLLLSKSEELKINFSEFSNNTLTMYKYNILEKIYEEVEYSEFESVILPIIKDRVLGSIDKAMKLAKKSINGIDAVVIVGGSSKLKPFENAMINLFGLDKIFISNKPQWEVSKGSAILDNMQMEHILNDNVSILMSDGSTYPIIPSGSKIGYQSASYTFSLVEDSSTANFIFTNLKNSYTYATKQIKTKGFLEEKLILNAKINRNKVAEIIISNDSISSDYTEKIEINSLRFKYNFIGLGSELHEI